jgi:hypothetical protein
MNSESHRIWRNRNSYAFAAILSLFLLVSTAFRLLTWKDTDAFSVYSSVVNVLLAGFLIIRCGNLASAADVQLWSLRDGVGLRAEDRLDELERLKRRDMVTPEEYAAKRQEILKDL